MCLRENVPKEDILPEVMAEVVPFSRHISEIQLYGYGEPLIAKPFYSLLTQLECGRIRFSTNGVALKPKVLHKVLVEARRPVSRICFSIDAATTATYENVRQGSDFEQVLRNLANVDAYRRKRGLRFPMTEIAFVAMKRNIRELADVVRLAGRSGVSSVHVAHVVVWDERNRQESLLYHPEEMNRCFAEAEQTASALNVRLDLPARISLKGRREHTEVPPVVPRCYMPWRHPIIKYNGDIQPCCAAPDALMGNVLEDSFAAIWNGDRFRRFRRRVNSTKPPDVCRNCDIRFRDSPAVDRIESVYIRPPPANR
jgi:radical SAM protein with 4Fe4S-binding SPASM domain